MPTVDTVTMHSIVAFQIAESIDIKKFRAAYDRTEHYQDSTEVYYVESAKYLYVLGRTLNVKNRIAQSLYILDSPEETWEDEYLSTIDSALKRTFEINARHRNIDLELQLVKDNLEVVKDLVYHRESKVLEWIIIALILVEVLNLFVEKILRAW